MNHNPEGVKNKEQSVECKNIKEELKCYTVHAFKDENTLLTINNVQKNNITCNDIEYDTKPDAAGKTIHKYNFKKEVKKFEDTSDEYDYKNIEDTQCKTDINESLIDDKGSQSAGVLASSNYNGQWETYISDNGEDSDMQTCSEKEYKINPTAIYEKCENSLTAGAFSSLKNYEHGAKKTYKRVKKYKCDICSVSYFHSDSLDNHILSVHIGMKYKCDQCLKKFSRASDLKYHINKGHKPISNNEKDDWYKCKDCERSFSQLYYLKGHIKAVHEGIKNKCPECDKTFTHIHTLKSYRYCT